MRPTPPQTLRLLLILAASLSCAACGDDSANNDPLDGELPSSCEVGETLCFEGELATCRASSGAWQLDPCPEGERCLGDGACQPADCAPGELACQDGAVLTCGDDARWQTPAPCEGGTVCVDGLCAVQTCEPGQRLCATDALLTCQPDMTWLETPCGDGWVCFAEQCVQCLGDGDCAQGEVCSDEGVCAGAPLSVLPEVPDAMVARPYAETLTAEGGAPPYAWTLTGGALPNGLSLSSDGLISGTPAGAGIFDFDVAVSDQDGAAAEASLSLEVQPPGLTITTDALPVAEEGLDYEAQLAALGGTSPYIWGLSDGALPAGLTLSSTGALRGTPSEIGDFPLTVRVFDADLPPEYADKPLTLTVAIAPLEIIGDQAFDLLFTKVIILPLIVVTPAFPVPYSAQLEARGGLRPYTWVETPLPAGLSFLISSSGLPDGLTLHPDGRISGGATDPSQVITVDIPLANISLTGFFFTAEVRDSQNPAESQSAVYLIPTVPL